MVVLCPDMLLLRPHRGGDQSGMVSRRPTPGIRYKELRWPPAGPVIRSDCFVQSFTSSPATGSADGTVRVWDPHGSSSGSSYGGERRTLGLVAVAEAILAPKPPHRPKCYCCGVHTQVSRWHCLRVIRRRSTTASLSLSQESGGRGRAEAAGGRCCWWRAPSPCLSGTWRAGPWSRRLMHPGQPPAL